MFGIGRKDGFEHQISDMRLEFECRLSGKTDEYPVLYWNHEYSEKPEGRPTFWLEFVPDFLASCARPSIDSLYLYGLQYSFDTGSTSMPLLCLPHNSKSGRQSTLTLIHERQKGLSSI